MADRILKRQFPHRGALDSSEINAFVEDVAVALERVQEDIAENESELSRRRLDDALSRVAGANGNYQRRRELEVEKANELVDIIGTSNTQKRILSFYDAVNVHSVVDDGSGGTTEFPVARRCPVDTKYGQVTLPVNGFKSLFWSATADDQGESLFLPEVRVGYSELSAIAADKVTASDPRNAFDGSSLDPYLIRAVYSIDADIEEVIFDVNIQVPQDIERRANVLSIEPAPELKCAITSVEYSPTGTVGNTAIPGMPTISRNQPIYDSNPRRWFFPQQNFTALKVRLSSRHFEIENGRKVFYVGLRELGLFLADWDQTWSNTIGAAGFSNNGIILRVDLPEVDGISPDTVYFDDLEGLWTNDELAESAGATGTSTGIAAAIYDDDTFSAPIWDSLSDPALDSTPVTVAGSKDHLWIVIELDRNNSAGVVPVLENLVFEYTVKS